MLGATRKMIRARVAAGRWSVLHRGVHAVGHDALTQRGRAIGALLATGRDAVLSHVTAAAVWGMLAEDLRMPHVTRPRGTGSRRDTLVVHHSRELPRRDRRRRLGLPVTSPERTVLGVAENRTPAEAAQALREARVAGLLTRESLERRLDAAAGRRGVPVLRALLDGPSSQPTRSENERRFLRLLRAGGLPAPESNLAVEGHLCDFVWPARRLIVETDDYNTHGDAATFESDRARDAALQRAGWRVQRFTRLEIRDEGLRVLATVAALMASAR